MSDVVEKIDTLIISHEAMYKINGEVIDGSTIIGLFSAGNWAVAGGVGLGVTIGVILGFVNVATAKADMNVKYLAAVVATIMGTIVIGFFSNNFNMLGAYGVGVGIGFIIYLVIYDFKGEEKYNIFKLK